VGSSFIQFVVESSDHVLPRLVEDRNAICGAVWASLRKDPYCVVDGHRIRSTNDMDRSVITTQPLGRVFLFLYRYTYRYRLLNLLCRTPRFNPSSNRAVGGCRIC